jgi:hypothetical protein
MLENNVVPALHYSRKKAKGIKESDVANNA